MEKIPEYILEAINCGEKNACDFYEKYGKTEVDLALSELKKSDEEILEKIDSDAFYSAVNSRIKNNDKNKDQKKDFKSKYFNVQKIVPFAVAAVLVVAILPGIVKNTQKSYTSTEFEIGTQNDSVRVKGAKTNRSKLSLYQQTKDGIVLLKNNAKVHNGDLIQLAYNSGKKYGLIFSIDGNQQVTNHFGTSKFEALEMLSKLTYLDYSYELDDAPDYEIFIMITGDRPFEIEYVIEELKGKKLNQLKNKKFIRKYIGENFETTTFVLIK